ncbi:MAG: hypothetical protein JW832_09365 [Deltaproteobacteria bacterium]|nr:hypothetical protein [Deltaproteobacteria bacterium]
MKSEAVVSSIAAEILWTIVTTPFTRKRTCDCSRTTCLASETSALVL